MSYWVKKISYLNFNSFTFACSLFCVLSTTGLFALLITMENSNLRSGSRARWSIISLRCFPPPGTPWIEGVMDRTAHRGSQLIVFPGRNRVTRSRNGLRFSKKNRTTTDSKKRSGFILLFNLMIIIVRRKKRSFVVVCSEYCSSSKMSWQFALNSALSIGD